LEQQLKKHFGMTQFRLGQKEILSSVLEDKDVLAILPTGGGKSLCYQLPAVLGEGITIVVSPLIALMNDQVQGLRNRRVPCGSIHSGQSMAEKKVIFQQMAESPHYLLYLSPERAQKPGFAPWFMKQKILRIVVDEAHCVSQWGHDFRPEYGMVKELRKLKPEVPIVALTATATPIVKRDIIDQLELRDPEHHVYGFYRPNLFYQVEFCAEEHDKEAWVEQSLSHFTDGKALFYCGTRKNAESWAHFLKNLGWSADFYHAGLGADQRSRIEDSFRQGEIKMLTATNAFGMGIDLPDIRLVVHTQMPGNIESYYQEVGRAGRDGHPSTCLLTYSRKDKGLHSYFIKSSDASEKIKTQRWGALGAMVHYAEGSECRHGDILTYFKDHQRIKECGHCDSCDPFGERKIKKSLKSRPPKKKKKRTFKNLFEEGENLSKEQILRSELLRDWRKSYAQENDIPAFMVFSDKTLKDLILRSPSSKDDLNRVYGLGVKKIEKFGKSILEILEMANGPAEKENKNYSQDQKSP